MTQKIYSKCGNVMNLQRLKDLVDNAYMSCAHPRITDVKVLVGKNNEVLDIFETKSSGDILYLDTNMPSVVGDEHKDVHIPYINILANMIYLSSGDGVNMFLPNDFGDYMVHNYFSLLNGYSMTLVVSRDFAIKELYNVVNDFYVENDIVHSVLGIDELKSKYEIPRGIYNCLNEFMLSLK